MHSFGVRVPVKSFPYSVPLLTLKAGKFLRLLFILAVFLWRRQEAGGGRAPGALNGAGLPARHNVQTLYILYEPAEKQEVIIWIAASVWFQTSPGLQRQRQVHTLSIHIKERPILQTRPHVSTCPWIIVASIFSVSITAGGAALGDSGAASGDDAAQTARYGSFQGKKEGREFFLLRFHWRTTPHVWFMNVNRMRSKVLFVCFHIYEIFPFPLKVTGKKQENATFGRFWRHTWTPWSNKINPPSLSHSHAGRRGLIPSRLLSITDSGRLCGGKTPWEQPKEGAHRFQFLRRMNLEDPSLQNVGEGLFKSLWCFKFQRSRQSDRKRTRTEVRAAACDWQTLASSSSYVLPQWNMMSFVSKSTWRQNKVPRSARFPPPVSYQ